MSELAGYDSETEEREDEDRERQYESEDSSSDVFLPATTGQRAHLFARSLKQSTRI